MTTIFLFGLLLLAYGMPAGTDGPLLSNAMVRRRLWQAGIALSGFAIIVGDYHAGGMAAMVIMVGLVIVAIGTLFWLDRGRFDSSYTRRSMGWYYSRSGPGGWPMGGHRMMAIVSCAVLIGLLILRPVAREFLGLNEVKAEVFALAPHSMMGIF